MSQIHSAAKKVSGCSRALLQTAAAQRTRTQERHKPLRRTVVDNPALRALAQHGHRTLVGRKSHRDVRVSGAVFTGSGGSTARGDSLTAQPSLPRSAPVRFAKLARLSSSTRWRVASHFCASAMSSYVTGRRSRKPRFFCRCSHTAQQRRNIHCYILKHRWHCNCECTGFAAASPDENIVLYARRLYASRSAAGNACLGDEL
jgi:hypothetical protein